MKKIAALTLSLLSFLFLTAQTPVNMAAQPGFTYTETFADIDNWTFSNSPVDGTFTAGAGASAWKGNSPGGSGAIPAATRITNATTAFVLDPNGSAAGVYRGSQSLVLLSTGTSDNTSAVAMDLFLNFTGLNAGTLSFDWASVNNSTGNRKSSLRVYASIDGTTFTEITSAAVLNFTNNSPTSGTVSFAALPAIFNNASTARLRFYYYNGSGGTTGSRPKLNIDNVSVTAVPSNPCTTPTAQPTSFATGTVLANSIQASFSAATPAADKYLVLMSPNATLSALPVNGSNYNVGDDIGDANVISISSSTSFTATGLSPNTTYYFFIFSLNSVCSGGPLYQTASPLQGSVATLSGNPPCTAPASQPSALTFGTVGSSSIAGSFSATTADEYLVVRSTSSTLSASPANGTAYSPGNTLGGGTVVSSGPLTNFSANGLTPGTTYYFFVFAQNSQNCTAGPAYNTVSPLTGSAGTTAIPVCTTPSTQPSNLNFTAGSTTVNGYFVPVSGVDGYLTLVSTSSTLSQLPQTGTTYTVGSSLGNATVLENNAATAFIATNLTPGTTYYFFVFAQNSNCAGGPLYQTVSPLQGNVATTLAATQNFYYGNLHAHSAYSDGNKDNPSFTPANDYAYAKGSQCFDFLGISEHNHSGTGMNLSKWQPGLTQAAAATTSNFLALYGMEWGVISNGGHVLVYGIDQLLGWEAGNYNAFVAKSDYLGTPQTTGTTGLFRFINNWGNNAFASLCHPSFSDYNNLANIAYNSTADSAIVGSAIASGPPFSTSTTYNDPPNGLGDLDYFRILLAKGYRIGPVMDGDNHNTNFGRANYNRLAVVSPSLDKNDFLAAMRNMRFYATEDCDTRVYFSVNNQSMGSVTTAAGFPSISIYVNDPTNAAAIPQIKIKYGIKGSGALSVTLDSVNAKTFNFTDVNLPANTEVYYYADITVGGARVITSPIWFTRTAGALPVNWLSFTADVTTDNRVKLNWQTAAEINNDYFVVERSIDGLHFQPIDRVTATNAASGSTYSGWDNAPVVGINYYRLKQINKDGSFSYSKTIAIDLRKTGKNAVIVQQNPVASKLKLQLQSTANQAVNIVVQDISGRQVLATKMNLQKGLQSTDIDVQMLPSGTYFISTIFQGQKLVSKFVKD
ncbi:MAG: T9SS type A sorting domain-containing protein [Chitinophagaceae bacterium]|nr:MAG: T9SS type A sorting domain-containing protein [Chitinophagaceae bacterium]